VIEPVYMSVVIPVRNGASTLGRQMAALARAQEPRHTWEVVVADNGSTDGTAAVAGGFGDRLPLRIVHAGRVPGNNVARNRGVAAARGHRVLLCDADDEVDPLWLVAMEAAFDAGHHLVAGPIDYRRLNPPEVRAWRGAPRASVGTALGFLPSGHGANMGFTRDVFDRVGGFDEEYVVGGTDTEFFWRAQLCGYRLHVVDDAIVHYRLRPSLRTLWRQARLYGAAEAHLYRSFAAAGVPRRSAVAPIREFWWLITRLPFARTRGRWGAWLRRLGAQVGRLEGAARYRVPWW
jgi:glycosyltransferase involved in cell wall biosynthesis